MRLRHFRKVKPLTPKDILTSVSFSINFDIYDTAYFNKWHFSMSNCTCIYVKIPVLISCFTCISLEFGRIALCIAYCVILFPR